MKRFPLPAAPLLILIAATMCVSCAHRRNNTHPVQPVIPSGAHSFTGPLIVQSGTLSVGTINSENVDGPLGRSTNPVTMGNANGGTGTFEYTGGSTTIYRKFTMAAGGTGAFKIDGTNTTVTLSCGINGLGGLTKTGPGTQILSGTNTYTGDTRINAGTLCINNPCLCNTSSVYLATGAKLCLNFRGNNTIGSLFLGDNVMAPGVYGATALGGTNYFNGNGTLTVTNSARRSGTSRTEH